MPARLFIGNISYDTTEAGLATAIANFGVRARDVKIITERETGRPRGFGFCEVDDPQAAIDVLNGATVDGRALTVNVARERERGTGGGGPRGGGRDDGGWNERRGGRR